MPSSVPIPRWPACSLWLGLGAVLLAGPAGGRAAEWQTLLTNTPFGQAPAAATTATGDLEFRGVVQEENVYYINLYNPATKTAQWIPVNGKAPGLEVSSYDAASDKVQIVQAGRPLTLSLKQARVALVAVAPPPAPVPPANIDAGNPEGTDKDGQADRRAQVREMIRARLEGNAQGGPGTPVMRNMPPEAQAMIEEFRRRRAEAAAGQQAPPRRQQRQP